MASLVEVRVANKRPRSPIPNEPELRPTKKMFGYATRKELAKRKADIKKMPDLQQLEEESISIQEIIDTIESEDIKVEKMTPSDEKKLIQFTDRLKKIRKAIAIYGTNNTWSQLADLDGLEDMTSLINAKLPEYQLKLIDKLHDQLLRLKDDVLSYYKCICMCHMCAGCRGRGGRGCDFCW